MAESFDVVVVGAGPAGSAAALTVARGGRSVCLLERGPFPGAKNMYGGVTYPSVLNQLVPGWRDELPVQRWITLCSTMMATETQSVTVDVQATDWGAPPYNGATTLRSELDPWLAGKAVDAGAVLVTSTTATGLVRGPGGRVSGVRTDRPDGDITAAVVIACDGVNSFLAKEAGLYHHTEAGHFTLGAKEVLALPRDEIDRRFGLQGDHGADFEILGGTGDVPGGAFLYTNADTISVGGVLRLPELARSGRRPEEFIADLKAHPSIAPLVEGGELKEYSAHLIPEGGYDELPELSTDGMLVAGDAAGLCLAAGIWLEGVNFAIASGAAAGRTASEAVSRGDTGAEALAGYRRRLEATFVLQDHRKLRRAPHLVLSERIQRAYPQVVCDLVEELFTVRNPAAKTGGLRTAWRELRKTDLRLRDVARDAWALFRTFG